MTPRVLHVDGVGFWATGIPGWPSAKSAFLTGEGSLPGVAARPSPALLPPAERRRAPDSVVLAIEAAAQAVAQSGVDPAGMATVFATTHGDTAITDYLCSTLAEEPSLISPTKFHNSVLNAAAGYWTILTRCTESSSALTAFDRTFAAGFVEAATQSAADDCPVLIVGYDTEASGALATITVSRGQLAVALVLSPSAGPRTVATISWELRAGSPHATEIRSDVAQKMRYNGSAAALPLLESLARRSTDRISIPLSSSLALDLVVTPTLSNGEFQT
jgi:hypothetical protein